MKHGRKFVVALFVIALALNATGCSKLFGPSDEEVINAINDSGILKSSGFTVTPPIVILEKGKEQNGYWPVKVKLKLTVTMANGQTKQMETTPTFKITKSQDSTGKTVWKAAL